MRLEIRVRSHGELWEMRVGACGRAHFFASRHHALVRARHAARLAWLDRCIPSAVRVLGGDGAWALDAAFGAEPAAAALALAGPDAIDG